MVLITYDLQQIRNKIQCAVCCTLLLFLGLHEIGAQTSSIDQLKENMQQMFAFNQIDSAVSLYAAWQQENLAALDIQSETYVQFLLIRADIWNEIKQLDSLINTLEEANALCDQLQCDRMLSAEINKNRGIYHFNKQNWLQANLFFNRGLNRLGTPDSENISEHATITCLKARTLVQLEQQSEADSLLEDLKTQLNTLFSETDINLAKAKSEIATYYTNNRRPSEAIQLLLENVTQYSELGISNLDLGFDLHNLGSLFTGIGDRGQGEFYYGQALEVIRGDVGVFHPAYGNSLNGLGYNMYYQGKYDQCLHYFIESLNIIEQTRGTEHEDYGLVANNIGQVFEKLGQYEKALEFQTKSLLNTEAIFGRVNDDFIVTLNNMGLILRRLKRYDEAIAAFETCLELQQVIDTSASRYGFLMDNLGSVYHDQKLPQQALPYQTKAVQNAILNHGKNSGAYDVRSNNLAATYTQLGEFDKALDIFTELLPMTRARFGEYHPEYATRLTNVASGNENMGYLDSAFTYYKQTNDVLIHLLKTYYPALSENGRLAYLNQNFYQFNRFYSFSLHFDQLSSPVSSEFLRLSMATKGLAMEKSISARSISLAAKDPDLATLYQNWNGTKQAIGVAYLRQLSGNQELMDSLIEKANELERELSNRSRAFAHTFGSTKNLAENHSELVANLTDQEAAIDIVKFQHIKAKSISDSTYYFAQVVRPGMSYPQLVHLVMEEELEAILEGDYVQNIEKLNWLNQKIIQPLLPYLEGVNRLFVAPDGLFHKIPLDVCIESSEYADLVDQFAISYVTNLKYIPQIKGNSTEIASAELYGGIEFDHAVEEDEPLLSASAEDAPDIAFTSVRSLDDSLRSVSFGPLAGTKEEVETIEKLFLQKGISPKLWSGLEASEEKIKQLSGKEMDVLHLATHGYFFTPFTKSVDSNTLKERLMTSTNPLFRSGLAMSGANYAWKGGDPIPNREDGIISAFEIGNLDFSQVDLVVLSACETGLGDLHNAEGVFGLQRAFQSAGVKKMLLSLWKVPDQETTKLMQLFYTYLTNNDQPVVALTKAKRELAKEYPPYYWAGFKLIE